ncbi:MAG: GGDEF domain-containing protein [Chitinispirillaceae bacterium]
MSEHPSDFGDKTVQISRSSTVVKQLRQTIPEKPCFVIIGGMDMGSVIPLDEPKITFGRDPQCTAVLRDDGVSRIHAEAVLHGPGSVIIRDRGSTNGTFVDGRRIKEAVLNEGDKVLLGRRTILKFEIHDQIEENYQKQIYESSLRDGLTGVCNRRYFNQRIVSDLSFARRHGLWFTLMVYDFDHFKDINDTFGHQTGDQVLICVSDAVLSIIRTEDVLARYGGEEFAVIAPGTNDKGGLELARRVLKRVESMTVIAADGSNRIIKVTVSIGTASVTPGIAVEPDRVISVTDRNLYEAKRGGRNRVIGSVIE